MCQLFTNHHTVIAKSNQKISLVYASGEEARLLSLTPGLPLIKYSGLMYDTHGRLAVFFEQLMPNDRFSFFSPASSTLP